MTEYGLDLYTYNVGALPYKAQEIDVTKEKNNLASMKEDLERQFAPFIIKCSSCRISMHYWK